MNAGKMILKAVKFGGALLLLVTLSACGREASVSNALSASGCVLDNGQVLQVGEKIQDGLGNEYLCKAGGRIVHTLIGG